MIVGLVGYPGSGKDTLGAQLQQSGWLRWAFADPMKEMLLAIDPAFVDSLERLEYAKRYGQVYARQKLQRLGQFMRDTHGEQYWINRLFDRLVVNARNVITDVRYENEADMILATGGVLVWINREGCGPVNDHKSEQQTGEIRRLCFTELNNDGIPEQLLEQFLSRLPESISSTSRLMVSSPQSPESTASSEQT